MESPRISILLPAALIVAVLLASGCTTEQSPQDMAKEAALDTGQEMVQDSVGGAVEQVADDAGQQLVNFKCVLADGREIYFLKEKASVKSEAGQSWLNDDGYFALFDIDGTQYLVEYPAEQSDMSFDDMMTTYTVSKTSPGYDCELNVVTEADVTPPDIQVITPDELGELMLQQMMAQGS